LAFAMSDVKVDVFASDDAVKAEVFRPGPAPGQQRS